MGYHYDWSSRAYNRKDLSRMPEHLCKIAESVANAVGMQISPQSAIVNYYKEDSRMGGHQDDAEEALDAPVISISLGRSAIFLKGNITVELQSG